MLEVGDADSLAFALTEPDYFVQGTVTRTCSIDPICRTTFMGFGNGTGNPIWFTAQHRYADNDQAVSYEASYTAYAPAPIPLPAGALLLVTGLAGFFGLRRRR